MMTNLFFVLDPLSSIFNLSLNWSITFMGLLIIPSIYWLMPYVMMFYEIQFY